MELLTKLRNLLLVCFAVGVVLAVAPVQPINAGEYEQSWEYYGNEDEYTSYGASSSKVECDAEDSIGGIYTESHFDSFSKGSWGVTCCILNWTGDPNETPPGGTVTYDFDIYGSVAVEGRTARNGPDGYAFSWASADGSGSAVESGWGEASGSVSDNNVGNADWDSSDEDGGATTGSGTFDAWAQWELLYVQGELELQSGQGYYCMALSVSCEIDAVIIAEDPSPFVRAYAYSEAHSDVDIYEISFDPN